MCCNFRQKFTSPAGCLAGQSGFLAPLGAELELGEVVFLPAFSGAFSERCGNKFALWKQFPLSARTF